MKIVYKSQLYKLLLLLPVFGMSLNANAQLETRVQNDNFTSFSSRKTYSDINKLNSLTPLKYRNHPDFGVSLTDSIQWVEQIDKRTLKTRTFTGPADETIIETGYDNINYIDGNGWLRAVDLKLKPNSAKGWSAINQENPVYLYTDASTALSLGRNELMVFNKNVHFNQQNILTSNYTVGDNGMYIKNVQPNTDKIIRFGRGRVETDYLVKQSLKLSDDLVISEDITLPTGYTIVKNTSPDVYHIGVLEVVGNDGNVVAEFRTPVCYDKKGNTITASYQTHFKNGGYQLDVVVPAEWMNNPALQYPVTIDPVITGPLATYSGGYKASCLYPTFSDTAVLNITIPGGITVTNFYVQTNFDAFIPKKYGKIYLWTCPGDTIFADGNGGTDTTKDLPGAIYIPLNIDIYNFHLTCCNAPSCSSQILKLSMGVTRDTLGSSGCNTNYVFYDPTIGFPFESYVVGHTVETKIAGSGWTITPTSLCANSCQLTVHTTTDYGVAPYTITHAWSKDTATYGKYIGCNTLGVISLALTIPNCPGPSCTASTLSVPPPIITDACGNRAPGLTPITINRLSVPDVIATPDSQTICSGTNANISLSSCVSGSTFKWTSSDGASGSTTPIDDTVNNNSNSQISVTYTVTPSGDGCTGDPTTFTVKVTPFNILISPPNPAICDGDNITLTASGDPTIYSWSPAAGLSCTTCASLVANPTVTTTYKIKGTNSGSCSATNSVTVVVNPNPTLSVSHDTTIFIGQSAHLLATTGDSVTWSPAAGLSCTNCVDPTATPSVTTTYTVTAKRGPCTVTATVTINVNVTLSVPSAFTPNSGNGNAVLHVLPYLTSGLTLQVFRVYNRWGQLLFETHDISDGWDGKFNGTPEPMGTYVYYAEALKPGQTQPFVIKGNVTLIR